MTGSAESAPTQIVWLPVDRWVEYKALRLEALRDAPQAFGSSYATSVLHPDDDWIERLREVERGRSLLLFAEREGRLVGMIGAFWGTEDTEPDTAMIVSVYVRPACRGQGVSNQLLVSALHALGSVQGITRGQLTVNPMQQAALGLYRRHGFAVVRSIRSEMGDGIEYDELVMEREIHGDG